MVGAVLLQFDEEGPEQEASIKNLSLRLRDSEAEISHTRNEVEVERN